MRTGMMVLLLIIWVFVSTAAAQTDPLSEFLAADQLIAEGKLEEAEAKLDSLLRWEGLATYHEARIRRSLAIIFHKRNDAARVRESLMKALELDPEVDYSEAFNYPDLQGLYLKLKQGAGSTYIWSIPSEAEVRTGLELVGVTPFYFERPPGSYDLVLSAAGFISRPVTVTLAGGQDDSLRVALRPEPIEVAHAEGKSNTKKYILLGGGTTALVAYLLLRPEDEKEEEGTITVNIIGWE